MDGSSLRLVNPSIPNTTALSGGVHRETAAKKNEWGPSRRSLVLRKLSEQAKILSQALFEERNRTAQTLFAETRKLLHASTQRDLTDNELADTLGLTLLQARLTWRLAEHQLASVAYQTGFLPPVDSVLGQLLRLALSFHALPSSVTGLTASIELILRAVDELVNRSSGVGGFDLAEFDTLLQFHDRRGRARHGVYFTPRPLAAFIVNEIDRLLRVEFELPLGLADTTTWSQVGVSRDSADETLPHGSLPFVNILDPAAGAGVFLIEVIDRIFQTWKGTLHIQSLADQSRRAAWNEFVAHSLLPRLSGMEMLLPACAAGWLRIAEKLASTGYQFATYVPLPIHLKNSLRGHAAFDGDCSDTGRVASLAPVTVLLGNPPFSALTTSSNPWIDGLLKASSLHGRNVGGYYEADGKPLGEKKLWLHDDYVKFLRLAQWQIERGGCGIVGLVTNHGYLDNLTFRGVRQSLLKTFPRISIVDLHGNRKKREVAPQKETDENVFSIDQGVAIGLFRCSASLVSQLVDRADLWGSRAEKLATMQGDGRTLPWQTLSPHSPHYSFAPHRQNVNGSEYARGFPLNEIMPVYSPAAVTARDSFAIAFSAEELQERLRVFSSPEVTDSELRQRFFNRTRSSRYSAGDTRGWKLPVARERARLVAEPDSLIQRCIYRPFDWRWILWTDWMVDWPRSGVMRHMLEYQNNLALVTRRQMLPDQPANYFYVADSIVLDGLIRSDNRGSESFFPLFLSGNENGSANATVNFTDEFWQLCRQRAPEDGSLRPEDVFFMIYAQFHSATYRDRYQAELCLGFPRVFVPQSWTLFRQLADYGRQLVEAHLLRRPKSDSLKDSAASLPVIDSVTLPARGYLHFEHDELRITKELRMHPIPSSTWQFHIGGYQVCRKWLRVRGGRTLSFEEVNRYASIVAAIGETQRLMSAIDSAISDAGGWPNAFL